MALAKFLAFQAICCIECDVELTVAFAEFSDIPLVIVDKLSADELVPIAKILYNVFQLNLV